MKIVDANAESHDERTKVKIPMIQNPYQQLHREFVEAGARILLSSGQACPLLTQHEQSAEIAFSLL